MTLKSLSNTVILVLFFIYNQGNTYIFYKIRN